ncbi:adenylate cyclase type 3-like [Anabrus simplex]|uniref:adenylate cyclase type 3-like n=1 Tax=Anabrus simplex TaxID=316456 RepID=UPI0035A279F6
MEPDSVQRAFRDPALERLYQSYSVRGKRAGLQCFVCAAILYDIYSLSIPGAMDALLRGLTAAFLGFNLALLAWCWRGSPRCPLWVAVPYLAWYLANSQLLAQMFLKKTDVTARDSLGWALLLDYLLFVTLPLRLRYCAMLSVGTCAMYLVAVAGLGMSDAHLIYQMVANVILLVTANLLGLKSFYLADRQQRRAFLETRQSLEMKLVIEEQSAEQERLLLSVLPEHVAVKMRQDLGTALDTQFKKIYMSRHENVSILYADIVGFTAISSTYSASELVKILNELFARFDRLSERYQQLRIKILGDCYYCISGAPHERPDHAVLCVHMGLSMVKAIKYVQQSTNSPVDMRVGIHTGAVLAGVLGQRQWQFDVYSKDVELANKMESSGLPGRVHISEKTLSYLNGEFEVEPALGEKREEMLRMAGIKTFFIVKALKPFQPDVQNGTVTEEGAPVCDGQAEPNKEDDSAAASPVEIEDNHVLGNGRAREDSEDFKKRLRKELINRDGHKDVSNHTKLFSLAFKDAQKEKEYLHHKESFSSVSVMGCPLVLLLTSTAQLVVLPRDLMNILSFVFGFLLLLVFSLISVAEFFPSKFPRPLVRISEIMNNSLWMRRVLGVIVILLLGAANVVDMVSCTTPASPANCTVKEVDPGSVCLYPSYFSYFCVLVLVAASLPVQLSYLAKAILLILIATAHCAMNVFVIGPALDCEEMAVLREYPSIAAGKYTLCGLLLAVTLALAFLARHMEKALRVLFLWKTEVEEQRERASDMRRRNEALVYNILPQHVAAHFMGSRKRQHEELYSQSYAEVGVLFASMPNFSDFYSEETVNNQGLECLRFLNEVISDFDALLELPQFQDIIKIKTIGSTYMAASGLNPSRQVKPEDPITVRWAHLALLVEFALELKKALQSINEQSFNHFVLKMGINHGPITAGVIGARKPHYDIWGNSVNVASRMESTGKAGCIQVTEETTAILKHFGYVFEQRGLVSVKGKGKLMTYYLIGKGDSINPDLMDRSSLNPIEDRGSLSLPEDRNSLNPSEERNSPCTVMERSSPNPLEASPARSDHHTLHVEEPEKRPSSADSAPLITSEENKTTQGVLWSVDD